MDEEEIKDKIRKHIRKLEDENDFDALIRDRAVVAISEDRQWLVVLGMPAYPGESSWRFYALDWAGDYAAQAWEADTGQDAHEVLEQFLRERDG